MDLIQPAVMRTLIQLAVMLTIMQLIQCLLTVEDRDMKIGRSPRSLTILKGHSQTIGELSLEIDGEDPNPSHHLEHLVEEDLEEEAKEEVNLLKN